MLHCRGLKNIVYFKEDYRDEYEFLKEDEEKKKGKNEEFDKEQVRTTDKR